PNCSRGPRYYRRQPCWKAADSLSEFWPPDGRMISSFGIPTSANDITSKTHIVQRFLHSIGAGALEVSTIRDSRHKRRGPRRRLWNSTKRPSTFVTTNHRPLQQRWTESFDSGSI